MRNKEKRRAYLKEWYKKNRERVLAYQKTRPDYRNKENLRNWQLKNRDKINARRRERYATIPEVREKENARSKEYKEKHKEESIAYAIQYAKDHPEWLKEQKKKYEDKHRQEINAKDRERNKERRIIEGDHIRELERERRKRKPIVFLIRDLRRKAKVAGAPGGFAKKEWIDLCDNYDNRCLCCGKKRKLTVDHVIPLSVKGSTNYISNLQCLCQSCNSSKGTKTIDYRPLWGNKITWCKYADE